MFFSEGNYSQYNVIRLFYFHNWFYPIYVRGRHFELLVQAESDFSLSRLIGTRLSVFNATEQLAWY